MKIELTGDSKAAAESIRDVAKAQREVAEASRDAGKGIEQFGRETEEAGQEVRVLWDETRKASTALDDAAQSVVRYIGNMAGIAGAVAALRNHLQQLQELRDMHRELAQSRLATAATSETLAAGIFGSTAQENVNRVVTEVVPRIVAAAGVTQEQARNMLAASGANLAQLAPGGVLSESAMSTATAFARTARGVGALTPEAIGGLAQAFQATGANTPEAMARDVAALQAGLGGRFIEGLPDIGAGLVRLGPAAAAAGIPMQRLLETLVEARGGTAESARQGSQVVQQLLGAAGTTDRKELRDIARLAGELGMAAPTDAAGRFGVLTAGAEAAGAAGTLPAFAARFGLPVAAGAFAPEGIAAAGRFRAALANPAAAAAAAAGIAAGAESETAGMNRAAEAAERAKYTAGGQYVGEEEIRKRVGRGTAAFSAEKDRLFGGPFGFLATIGAGMTGIVGMDAEEAIEERLMLQEARRIAIEHGRTASAAGKFGLAAKFQGIAEWSEHYAGGAVGGVPSINDQDVSNVMRWLKDAAGELTQALRASDARGFGPVGHPGQ